MIWQKLVIDRANELTAQNERLKIVLPRFIDLVVDLAAICDRCVPSAPCPLLEVFNGKADEVGLDLYWVWLTKRRTLSFCAVDLKGVPVVVVVAGDDDRYTDEDAPSLDTITTFVRSFFDGWEPQS